MNEIDHFYVFIIYSGDVTADVNHLYIKRIGLVEVLLYSYRDSFGPESSHNS
jgi:hypothetical protein